MTDQKYIYTFICFFLCSIFHGISADEACNKVNCNGPVAYYEELGCTPIYSAEDDCCAVAYNCDNLNGRSKDKCYVKNQAYEIGKRLRDEDAGPCDIGCTCAESSSGFAHFSCAVVDCSEGPVRPGCYRKNLVTSCCPGEEVCPENPDDRARCEVDGTEYRDGEYFTPRSEPQLNCVCLPGYQGQNVEPFCRPGRSNCNIELLKPEEIHNKCAPVYYSMQNPTTDCSVLSRCQNDNDTVVESGNAATPGGPTCTFGQLTMQLGDELNSGTDHHSVCVKCVCEVPPLPTCQRLPDSECGV